MSRNSRLITPSIAIVLLAACGDSPTQPSTPRATSIRIDGPASVAPGAAAQYRAIATFAGGSTEDITAQARWRSTNSTVLAIGSGGLANGRALGEVRVTAQYQNPSASIPVFVLEPGTFRVNGRVTESGGAGLPGARVGVLSGAAAGVSAITDAAGSYALYGLAGDVQIEISLEGYEKEQQSIGVNGHTTANVQLRPSIEPTDMRGDWRLTVNAAAFCSAILASDVLTRSYRVTMTQTGSFLHVQIKSPPIANGLSGRVIGSSVTISAPVDDIYYSYYGVRFYSLIETISSGRFLALGGTLRGEREDTVVTGTLQGDISLYRSFDGSSGVWNREMSCERIDHTFLLERN